jgi:hypothetical protein
MSERFDQLTAQHAKLRMHCAMQRRALGDSARQMEQQLAGVDRFVHTVRSVARNPKLIVGGVAVVALLGPRRVLRWAGRGALWFTTARRLFRLVAKSG